MWSIIGLGGLAFIASGYSLIYFATGHDYKHSKLCKVMQIIGGVILCLIGTAGLIYGVISTK